MRVRHAYPSNILRIVAGDRQRQSHRCCAWLILTKVGTNPSRGRQRRRRRPVEDRWTTSGCPSGPSRYNNSSCQSHPSRLNRFDSGRGENGITGAYVKDKTKGAGGRGSVDSLSPSCFHSPPDPDSIPPRNPITSPCRPSAVADSPT